MLKLWGPAPLFLAFWLLAVQLEIASAEVQRLQPLNETFQNYGIHGLPVQQDYPNAGAVVILLEQEYRQYGKQHEERLHKIIKVLSQSGASAATIVLPCPYSCRIEGRVIKPDGRIVALPTKDIVRSQKRSEFSAAFSVVQFLMPSAEPGDVLEYIATMTYPYPFLAEDFRFAEPFPILKAVLILTHPNDFSYSYIKFAPGTSTINVGKDSFQDGTFKVIRTTFATDNVPAAAEEPYSPDFRTTQPGIRIFVDGMDGRRVDSFRDWKKFGALVADAFRATTLRPGPIKDFIQESIKKGGSDPAQMLRLLHNAADKRIEIYDSPSRVLSGLPFQTAEEVFKEKSGTPEDFALFLATCFRTLNWRVDLILVNSADKPDASAESAFPPDLDMVFLKVRTPSGEDYVDCNSNGTTVGTLPSSSMNRFALGIPVLMDFQTVESTSYLMTMPFPPIVQSRLDIHLTPRNEFWNLQARWNLQGYLYQKLATIRYLNGDETFKRELGNFVRSQIQATIDTIDFQFLTAGVQLDISGSLARRRLNDNLELLQNPVDRDSVVHLTSSLFENRTAAVQLPFGGEIGTTYTIEPEAGRSFTVPDSYEIECSPLLYSFKVVPSSRNLMIQERWLIQGMKIQPNAFPQFLQLSLYASRSHNWSVMLSNSGPAPAALATQKVSLIPFAGHLPAPAPTESIAKNVAPAAPKAQNTQVPCKDSARVQVTGSFKGWSLFLRVENQTQETVDGFDLMIEFASDGHISAFKDEVHENASISAKGSHLLALPEEMVYDTAIVTVQFLQKGVHHECGPFQLSRVKK